MKVPKLFVYVERNPNKTATMIARDLGISQNRINQYINQANKSKYARVHSDKLISAGNGYNLMSKADPIELLGAFQMRLTQVLQHVANTKDLAYTSQIEAREGYLKITTTVVPQIATNLQEITKPLDKNSQIKYLENKLEQLKKE